MKRFKRIEEVKEQKKAEVKAIEKQIKENERKIEQLKREQLKMIKERVKEQKSKKKNQLTPEQAEILSLRKDLQILKFAVRTLILKDIETAKAFKFYEKTINVICDKLKDLKCECKGHKQKHLTRTK